MLKPSLAYTVQHTLSHARCFTAWCSAERDWAIVSRESVCDVAVAMKHRSAPKGSSQNSRWSRGSLCMTARLCWNRLAAIRRDSTLKRERRRSGDNISVMYRALFSDIQWRSLAQTDLTLNNAQLLAPDSLPEGPKVGLGWPELRTGGQWSCRYRQSDGHVGTCHGTARRTSTVNSMYCSQWARRHHADQ